MINNGSDAWYLIYSKPRQEDKAWWNLDSQGFRCYLPYVRVRRLYRRRYQSCVEPMFPRYLFIRLAAGIEDWSPIRSTQGVSGLVRFGTWPARVPDDLVDAIRERTEQGYLDLSPEPLRRGDKVKVLDGPFASYEGVFHAERGEERAIILLDVANQHTQLTISQHSLERV
ncbi:transcription/translation regulatory transformer protein RfaH [Halorhodospira halochloris]|uniref:Transcription antitermination protein RfaH n=1 Tax=Halorhodospira halochloris TaxID=1052 RepID=A0A2Z6EZ86_HALHR|nr:transcription/translation regulatory transformer protein RfaH [Halorhodospira halochloris]MBK1650644.1 transcription/translation regulatory transformer protein RfaH [Halorhodospira halochloris]MCG5529752.1 transcription/translation regulatory transformer protein RfaH [Halorhodospira halochloris]MCG5549061.1 transcription/translation regulatory transformer protein RfaH [Halorhodospira halochloris]BBE10945.1 transcription antitermination protein RfaH [Halorhodospira halochloris]